MAKGFWQSISGWWSKTPAPAEKASEIHHADEQTEREAFIREFEQLSQASDQAKESGDIKEAADLQARAVLALLKAVEPIANAEIGEIVADQLTKAGILKIQMDDYMFARMDFLTCLLQRRAVHKLKNTLQSAENLAVAYLTLAMIEDHENNLEKCIHYYQSYLEIAEQIKQQKPDSDALQELQQHKNRLLYLQGQSEQMEGMDREGQAGSYSNSDSSKHHEKETRDLPGMIGARNAGKTFRQSGMFDQSLNCLRDAGTIADSFMSGTVTVPIAFECAQTFNEMYETHWTLGDTEGTLEALNRRGSCEKFIYDETSDLEALFHYSITIKQKGEAFLENGDQKQAGRFFSRLEEIAKVLKDGKADPQRHSHYADALQKQGILSLEQGDLEKAGEFFMKSHQLFGTVAGQLADEITLRSYLLSFYWVAVVQYRIGNHDEAINLINHTIKSALDLYGESKNKAMLIDMAQYYRLLGDVMVAKANLQDAKKWYAESIELGRQFLNLEFNAQHLYEHLLTKTHAIQAEQAQDVTERVCAISKEIEDFVLRFPKSKRAAKLKARLTKFTG